MEPEPRPKAEEGGLPRARCVPYLFADGSRLVVRTQSGGRETDALARLRRLSLRIGVERENLQTASIERERGRAFGPQNAAPAGPRKRFELALVTRKVRSFRVTA